jgi:[acyl-carrier-protein] S-malonyltransferase
MAVHAFIFPGQGSQAVGMGRDLAAAFSAAREVFQEVDDTLGQKLSKLMFEGPQEELTLTENTQPALMAHSLAVLRVLEHEGGFKLADKAVLVAGHSLGEYSALAAAGSFSAADAARLLRLRGQTEQDDECECGGAHMNWSQDRKPDSFYVSAALAGRTKHTTPAPVIIRGCRNQ